MLLVTANLNVKRMKKRSRSSNKLTRQANNRSFILIFPTAPIPNHEFEDFFAVPVSHRSIGVKRANLANSDGLADRNAGSFLHADSRRPQAVATSGTQKRLRLSASRASFE